MVVMAENSAGSFDECGTASQAVTFPSKSTWAAGSPEYAASCSSVTLKAFWLLRHCIATQPKSCYLFYHHTAPQSFAEQERHGTQFIFVSI